MDTHIIQKQDLLEMLSRFPDFKIIVVDSAGNDLPIDTVVQAQGRLEIRCHQSAAQESVEEAIESLEGCLEKLKAIAA